MQDQFSEYDLTIDSNEQYFCSGDEEYKSSGFTKLMKYVLMTKKFPQIIDEIKKILACENALTELDKQNKGGWTALMLASANSKTKSTEETVKLLIDAGAKLNIQSINGHTALSLAVKYSNNYSTENTVKILIDANADINIKNKFNSTALMFAARYANYNIIKLLIDANADINVQDDNKITALLYACKYSKLDINIVKLLIDAGADINIHERHRRNALIFACKNSKHKLDINIIKLLIDSGIDINKQDSRGWNALMYACYNSTSKSDVNIVKLLIDNGADVNAKNLIGNTPLLLACKSDQKKCVYEIIELLINSGANLNVMNNDGRTFYENLSNYNGEFYNKFLKLFINKNVPKFIFALMRLPCCKIMDILDENLIDTQLIDKNGQDLYLYYIKHRKCDCKVKERLRDECTKILFHNFDILKNLKSYQKLYLENGKLYYDYRYLQGTRRYFTNDSRNDLLIPIEKLFKTIKHYKEKTEILECLYNIKNKFAELYPEFTELHEQLKEIEKNYV